MSTATASCGQSTYTSLPLKFELGPMTCFGQWGISKHDANRSLKCACMVGLASCTPVTCHEKNVPWRTAAPLLLSQKNREDPSLACILEPSPADLDPGTNSHQAQSRSAEPWLTQRPIIMRTNAYGHKPLRL